MRVTVCAFLSFTCIANGRRVKPVPNNLQNDITSQGDDLARDVSFPSRHQAQLFGRGAALSHLLTELPSVSWSSVGIASGGRLPEQKHDASRSTMPSSASRVSRPSMFFEDLKEKLPELKETIGGIEKELGTLKEKIPDVNDLKIAGLKKIAGASETKSFDELKSEVGEATSDEIVPRELLFGATEYGGPQVSPDGKLLVYTRPDDKGVLAIWVRTVGQSDDRKLKINGGRGSYLKHAWAADSETVLYWMDQGGDQKYHIFAVDAVDKDAEARDLTPFDAVGTASPEGYTALFTSPDKPKELLFSLNKRTPLFSDMYRCNLETGELELDTLNPGDVVEWGVDRSTFEVRLARSLNQIDDASQTIRIRAGTNKPWKDLIQVPYEESEIPLGFLTFSKDGKSMIAMSTMDRDTRAVVRIDTQTGEEIETLASNDRVDCEGVDLDPTSENGLLAAYFEYARPERVIFSEKAKVDFKILEEAGPAGAKMDIISRGGGDQIWVVKYTRDDGPAEYQIYDRSTGRKEELFLSQPALLKYKFARIEDVRIQARDGLQLVAYLMRPSKTEATPLILRVHGGPQNRDRWAWDPVNQFLVNRGYAVLQVQFRGSSGYGKKFKNMGDQQWGIGSMQHDLTDSVEWAIKEGIALKDKICIMGGSYGGYATLAGLAFTPELYACGVDIVGPSNIKSLLDTANFVRWRQRYIRMAGDVDDEEYNRKISPFYHVDKMQAPLLIVHGEQDPRVKMSESDQIAFEMKKKGLDVDYILYPDEGHGIFQPNNKIDFYARLETFLEKHLGGRAQPYGIFAKPAGANAEKPLDTRDRAVGGDELDQNEDDFDLRLFFPISVVVGLVGGAVAR